MPRRVIVFEEPDRFLPAAVGTPGDRSFYLQASQGAATVTVGVEKVQVAELGRRIGEILVAVGQAGGTAMTDAAEMPAIEQPVVPLFRVGALTLAWDPERSSVLIEARPIDEEGEYPEVADEDPSGPDLVRVWLDAAAARRFAVQAAALVAAGRPLCPFCGQPLDPAGHFCPRMNGHLN